MSETDTLNVAIFALIGQFVMLWLVARSIERASVGVGKGIEANANNVIFTLRTQARKEHVFFMRNKMEEFSIAFDSHSRLVRKFCSDVTYYEIDFSGKIDYEAAEGVIASWQDRQYEAFENDLGRVRTLSFLYGSAELNDVFRAYIEYAKDMHKYYSHIVATPPGVFPVFSIEDSRDRMDERHKHLVAAARAIEDDAKIWNDEKAFIPK